MKTKISKDTKDSIDRSTCCMNFRNCTVFLGWWRSYR